MNAQMTPQSQVAMDADNHVLSLQGQVSFTKAAALAHEGCRLLQRVAPGTTLSIDARGVQHSSSATLTVVLEWWRALNAHQLGLNAILLPEQMQSLVALSGLNRILPEC